MTDKLSLKLYPSEYMGMASVLARNKKRWDHIGLPGWQLPLANDLMLLGFANYILRSGQGQRWSEKNSTRQYAYSLKLHLALALWEEIKAKGAHYAIEQQFFDKLTNALVNYGLIELPKPNTYSHAILK